MRGEEVADDHRRKRRHNRRRRQDWRCRRGRQGRAAGRGRPGPRQCVPLVPNADPAGRRQRAPGQRCVGDLPERRGVGDDCDGDGRKRSRSGQRERHTRSSGRRYPGHHCREQDPDRGRGRRYEQPHRQPASSGRENQRQKHAADRPDTANEPVHTPRPAAAVRHPQTRLAERCDREQASRRDGHGHEEPLMDFPEPGQKPTDHGRRTQRHPGRRPPGVDAEEPDELGELENRRGTRPPEPMRFRALVTPGLVTPGHGAAPSPAPAVGARGFAGIPRRRSGRTSRPPPSTRWPRHTG